MTTSTAGSPEVLIVAAEASSALYAQRLLEHWQARGQAIKAFGIGSRAMEARGFEIVGRSEELAVVGVQEVISHWGDIKSAFWGLLENAERRKPKVALLLDYPDFNLRLAKKLKKMGIPVVYYISPQIWAWRQSRVHLIKKIVDKMLVLFPFEKDFYERHQVQVNFVGHPLLDEIEDRYFSKEYRSLHRSKYGISDDETVLALMPGSRRSEIKHHLTLQLRVAERLAKANAKLRILLLVAPTFSSEEAKSWLPKLEFPLTVVRDEPFEMIHLADVVLCASGTATLMVGLLEKPMVIMYRMNTLTAILAKMFVRSTAHFGLINLVLGRRVVPELFQEAASVDGLVTELEKFINHPDERKRVAVELGRARANLGNRGVTTRVAEALASYWSQT